MHRPTIVLVALALAATLGCGKEENKAAPPAASTATPPPAPTQTAAPKAEPTASAAPKAAQKVELAIESVANTMTFNKTALSAPAGAEVHLTFKNNSTMSTLPHNWVLVKTGTEATVAAAGLKMGEGAGYIDVRNKDTIAHTPLAKPGESNDVTFTAPDPGTYPYICTVPGHYMMMKGVLTVTP
jgi:azurin